jgi:hypothetical protein
LVLLAYQLNGFISEILVCPDLLRRINKIWEGRRILIKKGEREKNGKKNQNKNPPMPYQVLPFKFPAQDLCFHTLQSFFYLLFPHILSYFLLHLVFHIHSLFQFYVYLS